jgi:hypothetical protein
MEVPCGRIVDIRVIEPSNITGTLARNKKYTELIPILLLLAKAEMLTQA